MVGTRHYLQLATRVRDAGGKIVAVGDPAQLAEVDAGGIFTALIRHQEPLSLTGNQRQTADWERDALTALRDGDTETALAAYLAHGRVHLGGAPSRMRRQLAADYVRQREHHRDPYAVTALATTRRDVEWLNAAIRDQMRAAGHLVPDGLRVDSAEIYRAYAVGDLVLVTRNDHRVGLLNGTRATVTRADPAQLSLRTEDGKQVTVPTNWVGEHLDHGYAMTVHKAQGLTIDVALLYGATTLCQQSGYVGLSRGREANHLYTGLVALHGDGSGVEINSHGDEARVSPAEVISVLTDQLSRDRRQTLAGDQQPMTQLSRSRPDPHQLTPYLTRDPSPGRAIGRSR